MNKQFNKLFRVYIFDKTFTVRNAGGYPPEYMFSGQNPIGQRYDMYGKDENEVMEYVNKVISDEVKKKYLIMVKFLENTPVKTINE